MRDVFTMGARPIAMMNALRFGEVDHPKTRHLVSGVVSGIGGYGNCMGVPTVGGKSISTSYNGNILVNAMCVGLALRSRFSPPPRARAIPWSMSAPDRARRHSRRHHGVSRIRDASGKSAPPRWASF
jgi:hypothetical protein